MVCDDVLVGAYNDADLDRADEFFFFFTQASAQLTVSPQVSGRYAELRRLVQPSCLFASRAGDVCKACLTLWPDLRKRSTNRSLPKWDVYHNKGGLFVFEEFHLARVCAMAHNKGGIGS